MGAIKAYNYSHDELDISTIARGIAHPARVKIIKQLKFHPYRNIDFCKDFKMSKSTIKDHLDKLLDANLIHAEYFSHFYLLSLNEQRVKAIEHLMGFSI